MSDNTKIYPGLNVFFANRPGSHDWRENNKRPIASGILTNTDGSKRYFNLFASKTAKVRTTKTSVIIEIPLDANLPFLREPVPKSQG